MAASLPHPRARLAPLAGAAEMAARGAAPDVVFAAVVDAASGLLAGRHIALVRFDDDGTSLVLATSGGAPAGARAPADEDGLAVRVRRSGTPIRVDDFARIDVRGVRAGWGVRAAVAVPVVVGGSPWGLLAATSAGGPLPADTEMRLGEFADVVAAAVAGAQAWSRLRDLAQEQAALRRVAELVARGAGEQELFAAVAAEAAALVDESTSLARMEGERAYRVVAVSGGLVRSGTRIEVPGDDEGLVAEILRTGRPARLDDFASRRGPAYARDDYGVHAAVGVPIVVAGRVWGVLASSSRGGPLASGVEQRLGHFADLVAAAIAGAQANAELRALAEEQAALRRLAELAAREASVPEVLDALAHEASWLAGVDFGMVLRFEPDGATVIEALAGAPEDFARGMRTSAAGDGSAWRVWRTGRASRTDDLGSVSGRWPRMAHESGFTSSAAAPVRIDDALWGALVVAARHGPLPPGVEDHLSSFSELAGTVIASVRARGDLQALVEEQAALRRVAELVAHGAPLRDVFQAVADEASALFGGLPATLLQHDGEETGVFVAVCNSLVPVGLRLPMEAGSPAAAVRDAGRAVRTDDALNSGFADLARQFGVAATVGVPVFVEGEIWGTLTTTSPDAPLPAGTEERLASFAELAGVAIANAGNRAKLTASRARVVAAADETRHRLQRDVHDSAQQRLVHTIVSLKLARQAVADGADPGELVEEALRNAERASRDLRDVVRGILPAALTRGGLAAGLETLVDDVALPVRLRVDVPRLPPALETTAYFVIAEALTNVVKHASAREAAVDVALAGGLLVIDVRDDGRGGADPARGTGLVGMLDRVEAAEGTLRVSSPAGAGTTVHVELPVPSGFPEQAGGAAG